MTKIIIAHGIFGDKNEHWFPWLQSELEFLGHEVWCETLPNPEAPKPEEWAQAINTSLEPECIIIAHSLGVPAAWLALQQWPHKVKAFYSIAGFAITPQNEFTPLMRDFTDAGFDFALLAEQCSHWHVWTADDDPYLGIPYSETIVEELLEVGIKAELKMFPGRNHLGSWKGSAGKFPELLTSIKAHF